MLNTDYSVRRYVSDIKCFDDILHIIIMTIAKAMRVGIYIYIYRCYDTCILYTCSAGLDYNGYWKMFDDTRLWWWWWWCWWCCSSRIYKTYNSCTCRIRFVPEGCCRVG